MLLAELEVFHSRPIAPTRRISIGRNWLPSSRDGISAGFGSLLLGAVCARYGPRLADDLQAEIAALLHDLKQNRSVAQPRLRHRLQSDRVGLTRSRQRLYGSSASANATDVRCEFDDSTATPSQLVLGAAYAAGLSVPSARDEAIRAVRRGLAWRGEVGTALFSYLASGEPPPAAKRARAVADPVEWALAVLGLDRADEIPEQAAVKQGFREALRTAHPDLGANEAEAAERIADLSEARRILLAL